MSHPRQRSFRLHGAEKVAAGLFFMQVVCPAGAADVSQWDSGPHSAMRLIAADASREAGTPVLRAGIELKLASGWKTYWRYPGDSGMPPRFDFSRSENVKDVAVKWPAPQRFTDEGDVTIGYKGEVTFPVTVVPKDAAKPAVLRLDLDYAICEKLCVPAKATAELALAGDAVAHGPILTAAEARVPAPAAVGDRSTFAIASIRREAGPKEPRIVVDVTVPDGASHVDLFAEGPTSDWALPVPEPMPGAPPGVKRFRFALDGVPPGASVNGAALKLTAVADDRAIEVEWRVSE